MKHLHHVLAMLVLSAVVSSVDAQTNNDNVRVGLVQSSQCEVVAKTGSLTGSAVGTVAGAAVGGFLGRAVFGGKTGQNLGTVLGGLGGSAVGENVAASRTYSCLVSVSVPGIPAPVYVSVVRSQPVNVGQSIILVKDVNGNWLAS